MNPLLTTKAETFRSGTDNLEFYHNRLIKLTNGVLFILFRRRSGNHHRSGEASHYTEYEHYVIARLYSFAQIGQPGLPDTLFRLFGRDDESCLLPTGPGIHAFHEREFLLYTYQTRNHTPHPENDRGKRRHLCRQGQRNFTKEQLSFPVASLQLFLREISLYLIISIQEEYLK